MRGVRLLRAGVPEPRPHHHAAAADRAAPARCSGAKAAGDTALVARDRGRLRLRGHRHLRGRRHVPDGLPGADQHRRSGQAAAAGEGRQARSRAGRRRPGTGRAPPGRHRWPSTSPPCCRRRWSPGRTALGRKVIDADALPRGRRSCPRGGRRARRRRPPLAGRRRRMAVYLHRLRRHMFGPGRRPARGARTRSRSCASGPGSRCTVPAELPSLCCGTPWRSKGMTARLRGDAAGCCPRCGPPPGRASCPSSWTRRRAPRGCGRCWRPAAEPYGQIRVVDAVAFVGRARAAPVDRHRRRSRRWRCTPPARRPGWGSNDTLRRVAEAVADSRDRARQLGLLRVRR